MGAPAGGVSGNGIALESPNHPATTGNSNTSNLHKKNNRKTHQLKQASEGG